MIQLGDTQFVCMGLFSMLQLKESKGMQTLPLDAHVSDVNIYLKKVNCMQLCAKGATSQEKSKKSL